MIFCAERVWTGLDDRPIEMGFVEVEGNEIRAVGRASELGPEALRHDLGNVTLMPGLINAHVHLTFSASATVLDDFYREQGQGSAVLALRAASNMALALNAGVTTVRDLGAPNDVVFAARDAVRLGMLPGPDIVAAGEGITSPGGHCHFFSIEAAHADEVREAVRRQHAVGADVIKIFATGGHLTPGTDPYAPQFTLEAVRAAVAEAERVGLPVAAHAHAPEGIERAAAADVSTIEHCMFDTPEGIAFDERVAQEIADRGIAVVPTHGVSSLRFIGDPAAIEALPAGRQRVARRLAARLPIVFRNFARMRELGVELVAGSDAGVTGRRFADFPADLAFMANDADHGIGMGALETLRAATSRAARALGLGDRGVLQPGMRADLLAVRGDPLRDFDALTRTEFVMCAGRVVGGPSQADG